MQKNKERSFAFIWFCLGVLGRLLPHAPNMTPMNSLCLFGGSKMSRGYTLACAFLTLVISDFALAMFQGYPAVGWWSLFTYSGFAAMIFVGTRMGTEPKASRVLLTILGSSLGFWLWTNFGLWITADGLMYPRTLQGLSACYIAALPFLRNALVGDLAWGFVMFVGFARAKQWAPRLGLSLS